MSLQSGTQDKDHGQHGGIGKSILYSRVPTFGDAAVGEELLCDRSKLIVQSFSKRAGC